jgi:hypothetical protein
MEGGSLDPVSEQISLRSPRVDRSTADIQDRIHLTAQLS